MKKINLLSMGLSVCFVFALSLEGFAQQEDMHYPGKNWTKAKNPTFLGFSAEELDGLTGHLKTLNTQSLHVSVNGEEVYAYGDVSTTVYTASIRKSILAMLYGKYVKDGTIKLDATLEDLGMSDVGGLLPIEKQASIRDLIKARSGVYHKASNGGDNSADAPPRGSQKPGTYFLYNNWDFNAAGAVFEKLTGNNLYQELNDQLVIPLGFEDFTLTDHEKRGNAERSQYLAYYMDISARDLARVGHLMLAKGRWGDKQILDSAWVDEMVFPHTQNTEMNPAATRAMGLEYGYMWWVFDDDTTAPAFRGAYAARGHYGQYIAVLPALNMVISHKTDAIKYSSPKEYDAIRVSWDQFMSIVNNLIEAKLSE